MEKPTTILRRRIKASSLRKTAAEVGISPAYLSDIMKGKRNVGPKVLSGMGIVRIVSTNITYRAAK